MNLARLISPCTVDDFFNHHYEKVFLFNQRNTPGYYDEVLSEADLDLLLSLQDLNPVGIKVVKDGVPIAAEQWTKESKKSQVPSKTLICSEKIFGLYYQGATIIINAAEKMIPGLMKACSAIQQETRWLLQANVYITPPNSQGFSMHYDDHDIFTMQVKGPKKWKLYDTGEELPTSKKPFKNAAVLLAEIELNSGDLLYIPRGLVHEAFATDVSTIHVNFSLEGIHGFNLLESLAELAEDEDVFFRKMIPHALSSEEDISNYKTLFAEKLTGLMEKYSVEKLLQKQNEKFAAKQRIDLSGRFSDALKLEKLHINSMLVRRKGFTFDIKKTPAGTTISFGEHAISVSKILDISIFYLDEPFKVADIKGMITNQGKLGLAREFIEIGFLQILGN